MNVAASIQVINIPELLDLILQELPLPALLRSRRVSRSWRDTIHGLRRYKALESNPRIEIGLQLPAVCSISALPHLQTTLTLQHHSPVTIPKVPSCLIYGPTFFVYKAESGKTPRILRPSPCLTRCFNNKRSMIESLRKFKDEWRTLSPGIPEKMTWNFFHHQGQPLGPLDDLPADAIKNARILAEQQIDRPRANCRRDVGKSFTLHLTPGMVISSYPGTKDSLLAMSDDEIDDGISFGMSLPLVSEQSPSYCVVE